MEFLRRLQPERDLSNKDITLKTAMLLALTKMTRASELHLLDTSYMAEGENKIVFKLASRPKHLRKPGSIPKPIEFIKSGEDLCPVGTLKAYLQR